MMLMTMRNPLGEEVEAKLSILLEFLERTKDGKYAVIEKSSIPYARMRQETDYIDLGNECHFYYGMS